MRKLLLGLIGLLFAIPAVAATLPAGYTELQYIESTGTQYIDTGIYGNLNTEIEVDVQLNQTSSPDGNRIAGDYTNTNKAITINASNNTTSNQRFGDVLVTVNTYSSVRSVYIINKTNLTRNGVVVATFNATTPFTTERTLLLGTTSASTVGIIGKIYGAIFRESGNTVMSFVPAKNSSGMVGLYDLADSNPETAFHTNSGTGEFIAGPEVSIRIATTAYNSARFSLVVTELNDTIATIRNVVTNTINQTKAIADLQATKQTRPDETCPAGKKCLLVEDNDGQPHWYEIIENAYGLPNGYTALEYIENTDSQYINTGITVNSGTTVIATFQGTDDDKGAVFGYDQDYTGTMIQCYNGKWRVNNKTTDLPCTTKATVDITWTDDTSGRHVSTATINGITVPAYTNSRTYGTLMLFQGNGWDNANNYWTGGKIYSLSITQNNTLVRNFVPARNSSGVIGMYDTVSGRFFTNAGTGTFAAGPAVQ